jgi:hypothetical protein
VQNGSFELDQQPASTFATAPPSGWSMLSSNTVGHLLHAVQHDGQSLIPSASDGLNVAYFDSLTSSSYREAQSACFPVEPQALSVHYQVQVPETQNPSGTRAAVKLWYFQDSACAVPSAVRVSDTQTAASNSVAGVWELRNYAPSRVPPSDGVAAKISIRAQYSAGLTCGDAGADCQDDRVYFDDIAVSHSGS